MVFKGIIREKFPHFPVDPETQLRYFSRLYLGKQELMRKNWGTSFGLPRLGVGAALLALFAFTSVSRAGLFYEFTLTDVLGADVVSGYGQIVVEGGYSISGTFTVTSGPSDVLGVWTLTGGSSPPPSYLISPSGKFDYDNAIYPGSDPFLTTTAGILFTRSGGDELNIWANNPNNYSLWTESGGNYVEQFGAYPGGGDNYLIGTITAVPEPITSAMAVFVLLFVVGTASRFYLGRRHSVTA
jgi:hypothetical protein